MSATVISKLLSLFDSHCHFDFDVFADNRKSLWAQCQAKGIRQLLIPGVEPNQWSNAQSLCEQYQGVYTACGLHPWWVDKAQLPSSEKWQEMLNHPQCVAVGECGLDREINAPLDKQISIFEQHLVMATQLELPVIVHVRNTHNETIRLLKKYHLPSGGVIHGFTGSKELAMTYWQMGFYLGVGGSITYPRAKKTIAAIRHMPLESLLLETDAPDMPLCGRQGQTNSPLSLVDIAYSLAFIKGVTLEQVARITAQNSRLLFGI